MMWVRVHLGWMFHVVLCALLASVSPMRAPLLVCLHSAWQYDMLKGERSCNFGEHLFPWAASKTFLCNSSANLLVYDFSLHQRFLFLVTGTFASFLAYGYVQELLFATPGLKQYGWFITTFQFAVYAVLSAVEIRIRQIRPTTVSSKMFAIIAFFTVATMGLSNTSLAYLSYPAQVAWKCLGEELC